MSLKNFFIDSIKYSFQEKITFLIFGLLLVALAFLPDVMDMALEPLKLIESSPVVLISLLISLILLVLQGGYLSKVLEEIVLGSDDIPPFREITLYLKEGIKDLVLALFYSIPVFLISFLPQSIGEGLYGIIMLILLILCYFSLLMLLTAIPISVLDGYKKAFNIIYVLKKSREVGFKRLHIALILAIIIVTILMFIVVTNNDPITTVIIVAIGFFVYPILAIMEARYIGLIGREILNKK